MSINKLIIIIFTVFTLYSCFITNLEIPSEYIETTPETTPTNSSPILLEDLLPPQLISNTINTSCITAHSVILNWQEASDDIDSSSELKYQVFYSLSSSLDSTIDIINNGISFSNFENALTNIFINNLNENKTYYFNVIVKDSTNKQTCYNKVSIITLDDRFPISGNSGLLTFSDHSNSSITVNWSEAIDDYTPTEKITYNVFYSTSNNINSLTDIFTNSNGTSFGGWQQNINSQEIISLLSNTTYYFNVVAVDEVGNRIIYNSQFDTTLF